MTLTLSYDGDNNVTSVADSLGGTVSSYFDALGNLTSRRLSGSTQARFDMTYDANSNLLAVSRYADAAGTQLKGTSALTYDAENNLTSLVHKNAANTVLASYSYSYDAGARLTSETDNGTTTNYTYDSTNQITASGSTGYAWDANGNTKASGVIIGQNNQLLSDSTWNYTYDKEGNLTQKVGVGNGLAWTYGYDNVNQMTSAVQKNSSGTTLISATYTYDVFGNRIASSVTQSGTTTVTHYAYLNGQLWADLTSTNTLQTRYLAGNAADQWFARVDSTGTYWLLPDHLGSIRDVMNSSGTVIDHINYDAFGAITSETSSSNGGRLKYAGYEWDSALSVYHAGARYYDPASHRWMKEDPIGFDGGDTNLDRYVGNGPTDGTDPSGLQSQGDYLREQIKQEGLGIGYYWQAYLQGKIDRATYEAVKRGSEERIARLQGQLGDQLALEDQARREAQLQEQAKKISRLPALDLRNVSKQDVDALVKGGQATEEGNAYVVHIPELKAKLVLAPVYTRLPTISVTMPEVLAYYKAVGIWPDNLNSRALADAAYNNGKDLADLAKLDFQLTFFLHALPGGTQGDYLVNGEGNGVDSLVVSTVDDVAAVATLGGTRWVKVAGLALQGGALAYKGTLLYKEATGDQDARKIAALSGEIVLRLIALGAGAKGLVADFGKAKVAANFGRSFTWQEAEEHLASLYPGGKKANFKTGVGTTGATTQRKIDWLDVDNIAHEAKSGYQGFTSDIEEQILKDKWLIDNGRVEGAQWHFYRSKETGKIGADPRVLKLLDDNKIPYTFEK